MNICGLQKTTLLDYPGRVASTIFLGGCNFRCPFCHNSDLLDGCAEHPFSVPDVLAFLKKRSNVLEGVCITGGEPTLHPELEDFIRKIRSLGLAVKLDTNGFRPEVLKRLCEQSLIDYAAMDIKAGRANYGRACGVPGISLAPIEESVAFLGLFPSNSARRLSESSTPKRILLISLSGSTAAAPIFFSLTRILKTFSLPVFQPAPRKSFCTIWILSVPAPKPSNCAESIRKPCHF